MIDPSERMDSLDLS
uniref:Uncharacterized protein n=1 Tax=Lepeophtheirus salmonis TaxID=72036 RepID=A0A0K2V3F3_LEPSM